MGLGLMPRAEPAPALRYNTTKNTYTVKKAELSQRGPTLSHTLSSGILIPQKGAHCFKEQRGPN